MKKQTKILTEAEYYMAVGFILIVAGLINDPVISLGVGGIIGLWGLHKSRRKK